MCVALATASLVYCYAGYPGVKELTFSRRLGQDADRRVGETNAEGTGPACTASNSVTPTNPGSGTVTDTAPTLRFYGLPTHLSLNQFLKRVRFAVRPNKAASLQIMLRGTVNQATIADAFDLTLAHKVLGMSAAKRTITVRPSRKLVGNPRRAKVELVVVTYDGAGSRSTTTRAITIRR